MDGLPHWKRALMELTNARSYGGVVAAVGEAAEAEVKAEAADVAAAAMEEEEGGEEEEAEAEAARLMVAGPVACQAERAVAAEAAVREQ